MLAKENTACAVELQPHEALHPVHRADAHVGRQLRRARDSQRAVDAIEKYINGNGSRPPKEIRETVDRIFLARRTPLVVWTMRQRARRIYLKDIVKGG